MPGTPLPPFQAVLDEHGRTLHRYLVTAVGPHDGADCFQETMLAALRAYPSLGDGRNLGGWLFTIAHRKVIDHVRARDRRPLPVDVVPDTAAHQDAGVEETIVIDEDLWLRVGLLPPKQRSAVLLRHVADRPYCEIALALECSEDAARQNVRAGLARLRQEVAP